MDRAALLAVGEEMISPLNGGMFSLFASPSFMTFEVLTRLDLGVGSGVRGHWVERAGSAEDGETKSATVG